MKPFEATRWLRFGRCHGPATERVARHEATQMRAAYLSASQAADFAPQVPRRWAARNTADRLGATANQVVLGWLIATQPGIVPAPGVSLSWTSGGSAAADVILDEQALGELASARALSTLA